jgi:hypothetical protein
MQGLLSCCNAPKPGSRERCTPKGSSIGRKSRSGGLQSAGSDSIPFTHKFLGVRCCPTLSWIPTEITLRRTRQHLTDFNVRIAAGTSSFAAEFPDYRHVKKMPQAVPR